MDEPRRYESIKHIVGISKFVLDVLVLVLLLTSGWPVRIRAIAETAVQSQWLIVIIYMAIVGAILKAIDLPFSFYSGYILEHQFGLSRQSLAGWMKDQVKGFAVGAPLSIAAIELIYFLL